MLLFRTSQFIISLNKYLEAVNYGFAVGMRFKMRFEGEDSPERRYLKSLFCLSFIFICSFIDLFYVYVWFGWLGSLAP